MAREAGGASDGPDMTWHSMNDVASFSLSFTCPDGGLCCTVRYMTVAELWWVTNAMSSDRSTGTRRAR